MDIEATEAKLECQWQDFVRQQATHHLGDDNNTRTGAPSGLSFPYAPYNMVATTCCLEDIFDMPDERLNEAKRLLCVTLEQQAKSSASQCHAAPTLTPHRLGRSSGDTSGNSSDRP